MTSTIENTRMVNIEGNEWNNDFLTENRAYSALGSSAETEAITHEHPFEGLDAVNDAIDFPSMVEKFKEIQPALTDDSSSLLAFWNTVSSRYAGELDAPQTEEFEEITLDLLMKVDQQIDAASITSLFAVTDAFEALHDKKDKLTALKIEKNVVIALKAQRAPVDRMSLEVAAAADVLEEIDTQEVDISEISLAKKIDDRTHEIAPVNADKLSSDKDNSHSAELGLTEQEVINTLKRYKTDMLKRENIILASSVAQLKEDPQIQATVKNEQRIHDQLRAERLKTISPEELTSDDDFGTQPYDPLADD